MRLDEQFFARHPLAVAGDLVGRELVRDVEGTQYHGVILEAAIYHGRGGRTAGGGIAYAPGKVYIMPYRGRNFFNIATEAEGIDSCVQIRRVQLGDESLGPLQLAQRLQVGRDFDGQSVESYALWLEGNGIPDAQKRFISPGEEKMAPNCLGYWRLVE